MELVSLKVKIGLRNNGQAKYPDFNALDVVKDSGVDWSKYIDVFGLGWHYDKTSGHQEATNDSPMGQQWGMLLVPEAFADQAKKMFPDEVEELDETQTEDFYENKAHAHEPDEKIDRDILESIKLKQDLKQELTEKQIDALDPTKDEPGIIENKEKVWSEFKTKVDAKIISTKIDVTEKSIS